jgi:hypothetical protein
MGESFVYVDDSEFADAEAGSEPGMTAGGDGPPELPEELARGVVCLECVTSPEAMEAGEDSTCRVYVVGTAHVSQVLDLFFFENGILDLERELQLLHLLVHDS